MGKTLGIACILLILSRPIGVQDVAIERGYAEGGSSEEGGEVLIGYFGPSDPCHVRGGQMWQAASLAVERANLAGGYEGGRFRLVAGWSEDPWGTGVKQVVRMAYADKVWAVIGGIDGPSTHLAEQVITKAQLTLLSPGSTDKTTNLVNIPWMFSALPADNLQTEVLADEIDSRVKRDGFVIVSAVDHDSHLFAVELVKSLGRREIGPSHHFQFDSGDSDFAELADRVLEIGADTVGVVAGMDQSALVVRALRDRGFEGLIFGGPSMGTGDFGEAVGAAGEGVVFPLLYVAGEEWTRFDREFLLRFGERPDYLAGHAYDCVNIIVEAIRQAGLDRAEIRDAVKDVCPWGGVAGEVRWDSRGSNSREVVLGTIESGRAVRFEGSN